jgi:hypothetical protein
MPDNFLLFLSETTPPTPPEMVLHGRTNKAATHTQHTFCVYALLLAGINYFTHFTKKMGSMSREKLGKLGNIAKIFVFMGLLQPKRESCLFVKKLTGISDLSIPPQSYGCKPVEIYLKK